MMISSDCEVGPATAMDTKLSRCPNLFANSSKNACQYLLYTGFHGSGSSCTSPLRATPSGSPKLAFPQWGGTTPALPPEANQPSQDGSSSRSQRGVEKPGSSAS